jgi:hypothetical protein
MNFTAPVLLAPLGGLLATFGLAIPFLVSAGMSLVGLIVITLRMVEAKEVKERIALVERKKLDGESPDGGGGGDAEKAKPEPPTDKRPGSVWQVGQLPTAVAAWKWQQLPIIHAAPPPPP